MDDRNKKTITIISFMRRIIIVFFTIFFNIYVLKIVNDLGLVIKMNIVGIVSNVIFSTLILKILNNKNIKYFYRLSFIILVLCIGLLLLLKDNIIKYIYLFKILYALEDNCYYRPYEMIVMGSNNHKTISTFHANINILTYLATIITPILSGIIIEKFSYYILFILLIIEALTIIFISTKISKFYIPDKKINIREYLQKAKKYKHINNVYKCMFYRRISTQGAVRELLPIILFLRLKSELGVGTYSSLFAILSICSLTWLKQINKKNIKKKFYVCFSILVFLSSLLLVFIPNYITLLVYYIFMNSFAAVVESESCSIVYEAVSIKELSDYSREHDLLTYVYMFLGQFISYLVLYILYTYFYNVNILFISISILIFFLIISSIYLQKAYDYMEEISK